MYGAHETHMETALIPPGPLIALDYLGIAVFALVPATRAVLALWRDARRPAALVPAIVGAITAALLHAALLALGLALARLAG